MKRGIIIMLVVCGFADALVAKDRREVSTEESPKSSAMDICSAQTPCAWSVYSPHSRIIETNITNSYCKCSDDTECVVTEEDLSASAYLYRCRKPSESGS